MSSDVIALLGTTLRITNNGVELSVATPYNVIAIAGAAERATGELLSR